MADIGTLALKLTANAQPMVSGLNEGAKACQSFAEKGASVIKGGLDGVASSALSVVGFLGPVGIAALGVGKAFQFLYSEGMKSIGEQGKLAMRFGISTTAAAGLQQAARIAGLEIGDLAQPMEFFSRTLVNAADGSAEAQRAFRELGLDARELTRLPLDQQLQRVSRAMQGLSEQERILAERQLFGRAGGADLMRALKQQEKGLEQARRFGLAATPAQVADVKAASEALKEANAAFAAARQSLGQTLATTFAPLVRDLANFMAELIGGVAAAFRDLKPMLEAVASVIPGVSGGGVARFTGRSIATSPMGALIATVGDSVTAEHRGRVAAEAERVRVVTETATANIRRLVGGSAHLRSELGRLEDAWITQRETLGMAGDEVERYRVRQQLLAQQTDIQAEMRRVVQPGAGGGALRPAVFNILGQALEQVGAQIQRLDTLGQSRGISIMTQSLIDQNRSLEEQVVGWRLSADAIAGFRAAQEAARRGIEILSEARERDIRMQLQEAAPNQEAADRQLRLLDELRDGLRLRQEIEQAMALARRREQQQVMDQTRRPLAIFEQERQRLDRLGLDADTYALALGRAADELERAAAVPPVRAPSALTAGSQQAAAAIVQHQLEGLFPAQDRFQRLQTAIEVQTQIEQQQLDELRDLARQLGRPNVVQF